MGARGSDLSRVDVIPVPAERWGRGGALPRDASTAVSVAGVRLAIAAVVVQSALHLLNYGVLGSEIRNFDAGAEGNMPTWASVVATFAGGFVCLLHAVVFTERRRRFLTLAGLLAFFSLDDAVQIHEVVAFHAFTRLGAPEDIAGRLFPALYVPLLALCFWLLWDLFRHSPRDVGRVGRAGLALLLAAIGLEIGTGAVMALTTHGFELLSELEIGAEEGAELGGWILIASALTAVFLARECPQPTRRIRKPEAAEAEPSLFLHRVGAGSG